MNKNEEEYLVERIRTSYMEKQDSELDELKALDKKVKRPVNIFAYALGTVSALVMGSGMSLVMTDIGKTIGIEEPMIPGIAVGIAGLCIAIINYPIYKKLLEERKRKYAEKIIEISDRILKS